MWTTSSLLESFVSLLRRDAKVFSIKSLLRPMNYIRSDLWGVRWPRLASMVKLAHAMDSLESSSAPSLRRVFKSNLFVIDLSSALSSSPRLVLRFRRLRVTNLVKLDSTRVAKSSRSAATKDLKFPMAYN